MTTFSAEVFQNEYLPQDGTEVNAIVTVRADAGASGAGGAGGGGGAGERAAAAEVVIIDTSGSMDVPKTKIKAAREATAVAIDCIRDGVWFGVVDGAGDARQLYPEAGSLVPASAATREAAKRAVAKLKAGGGTRMGRWLALADTLLQGVPADSRHAILLTDGANNNETPEELDTVLATCEGRFQCDCRGVGTDWEVSELRRIASTLLGTVDIIPEPEGMAADFRALIERAMGKATSTVALRLWSPQGASVRFVRQVAPTIEELTERATRLDALTAEYPTGTWGSESRDYHVCIDVAPRGVGDEMLAGRVSVILDGEVATQGLIKATWTEDERLSTRISREVAHYTGQAELADAIQDGLEARRSGDEATATFQLGKALRLAEASGNDGTVRLLERVVEVTDAATGTVRLRAAVADADEMALDTRSTKTVRVGPGGA